MTLQQAIKNSGLTVRIFADVRDGSLISQHEPNTGTQWTTVEGSVHRAGAYYQDVRFTDVPPDHPVLKNLPDNCWIDEK